jgi:hypothetical protein
LPLSKIGVQIKHGTSLAIASVEVKEGVCYAGRTATQQIGALT